MKKFDNYYARIPKEVDVLAHRLKEILEKDWADNNEIMNHYLGKYWEEFTDFWKQGGETLDWITFACAPHNSIMFIYYVFKEYPEVMSIVENDIHFYEESLKNETT